MKRTLVLAISVVLVVGLVVAGCAPAAPTPAPEAEARAFKIGIANFVLSAPYFVAMSDAAEEEAAFFENVEVFTTDGQGDAAKMTSDVEDLLAKDVDGILINAGPIEALPAALAAADEAGIPVVMVDRLLQGGEYTSWIGPDNYLIGVQDGQYIVDRLGGEGLLLDIRGGPADNTIGLDRTNGMLSVVEQSNIEVVYAPDFGGWSEDGGFTIMEDMLAMYDQIDIVFCENDSMCLGAQKAIEDAGRSDEMFLCGVDGQKEALKAIMDGTNYACTGKNDSDEIGRAGFHRLMAVLAGGVPEKDTVLPSPLITIDNACQYYNPDSLF
jgi:ribose transport system substrate-binding protein